MEHEEIKIANLLNEFLLNTQFIKKLSKSGVSEFIKLDEFKSIRFFQANNKLGIDFININNSILNSYLFNDKGYLESSFTSDIELTFENNLILNYKKINNDLEKNSELESIRISALEQFEQYKKSKKNFIKSWLDKNLKLFNFIKHSLFNKPLLLEEPNDEFTKLKDLFTCVVNKQLSFVAFFNFNSDN